MGEEAWNRYRSFAKHVRRMLVARRILIAGIGVVAPPNSYLHEFLPLIVTKEFYISRNHIYSRNKDNSVRGQTHLRVKD